MRRSPWQRASQAEVDVGARHLDHAGDPAVVETEVGGQGRGRRDAVVRAAVLLDEPGEHVVDAARDRTIRALEDEVAQALHLLLGDDDVLAHLRDVLLVASNLLGGGIEQGAVEGQADVGVARTEVVEARGVDAAKDRRWSDDGAAVAGDAGGRAELTDNRGRLEQVDLAFVLA